MKKYDIAAYVWPAYTGDEVRTRMFWPQGMGEWQTVMNTFKRYPNDSWPRRPLWGYQNEADPYVMQMQIDAAVDHGVNVFIYDWYWYDRSPFLEQCLDNGFLKAKNNKKMKFYLMWANHDACSMWNKKISDYAIKNKEVIWKGSVDFSEFKRIVAYVIENYFTIDNYYKINGCPVFMIYRLKELLEGFDDNIEKTAEALAYFREEVKKAGFPDLHLQVKQTKYSPIENMSVEDIIHQLGFDSTTDYQFCDITKMNREYSEVVKDVEKEYERLSSWSLTYFPHVSVGWDNNPRYNEFRDCIVRNNTPEEVEKAFRMAKAYVDAHPNQAPLITVNSWNEWTETSYLEPDDLYGYGYLEAIKRVFCE